MKGRCLRAFPSHSHSDVEVAGSVISRAFATSPMSFRLAPDVVAFRHKPQRRPRLPCPSILP
jgi:hypothetical protein